MLWHLNPNCLPAVLENVVSDGWVFSQPFLWMLHVFSFAVKARWPNRNEAWSLFCLSLYFSPTLSFSIYVCIWLMSRVWIIGTERLQNLVQSVFHAAWWHNYKEPRCFLLCCQPRGVSCVLLGSIDLCSGPKRPLQPHYTPLINKAKGLSKWLLCYLFLLYLLSVCVLDFGEFFECVCVLSVSFVCWLGRRGHVLIWKALLQFFPDLPLFRSEAGLTMPLSFTIENNPPSVISHMNQRLDGQWIHYTMCVLFTQSQIRIFIFGLKKKKEHLLNETVSHLPSH